MKSPGYSIMLLSLCQALLLTNNVVMVGLNGIVGASLLGADKSLATLPVTAYVLGTACATVPASLWMQRVGRRAGFVTGGVFGLVGAAVGVVALARGDFWLLCAGTLLVGGYNAFGQYYRFAAVEAVPAALKSRAVSLVLAGGLVGAVAGPEGSRWTESFLPIPFEATYIFLVSLAALALVLQALIELPSPPAPERSRPGRPLREIASQRAFIVAVLSGMLGYAAMNFLMTAAPLAMVSHHHSYSEAAFVIEWHVVAMFAPSFVTGSLIQKFGTAAVIRTGAAFVAACIAVAALGPEGVATYWTALVLLGVGWNFLYVAGTTLLTDAYRPNERAKTQAMNDQLVFLGTATSSALAGWLMQEVGWPAIAIWSLPLPIVILTATLWRRHEAATVAPLAANDRTIC